jgi:hypothetical protein
MSFASLIWFGKRKNEKDEHQGKGQMGGPLLDGGVRANSRRIEME